MKDALLRSLSMEKYELLLPLVFPGASGIETQSLGNQTFWTSANTNSSTAPIGNPDETTEDWTAFEHGIERRQLANEIKQFRSAISTEQSGDIGWLVISYEAASSIPVGTAPDSLKQSFAEAMAFLTEEVDLQLECNQLAAELTERYEELNLVYSTKDHVDVIEEGQEALNRLVHNCADYLDVGMAALICRERSISLHSVNNRQSRVDAENWLELMAGDVYDRVESQASSLVVNDADDIERRRLLRGKAENLLVFPILDDHGEAIGIIGVVAHRDNHLFSNGDRNLLEVMTKKAARIIHTHHDSLTGLINRSGFEPILVSALSDARKKNLQYCLLHVDLDQLHVINDLLGYQEGDVLIRRAARSLRSSVRESDCLARLGGDEFAVLLPNCGVDQGQRIAEKICSAISSLRVVSANRQLDVSTSVGIVEIRPNAEGIVSLMASAEIACKAAKEKGRDRVEIYAPDNTKLVQRSEEIEWIGHLQKALRDDEFELHCQPVIPMDPERDPLHFEILIRLRDSDGKLVAPGQFLPAAERYQLMPQIDRWVIHQSLTALEPLKDKIEDTGAVFCINLSGQSLTSKGFLYFVSDELKRSCIDATNICFEITETAAIANIDEALAFMREISALGCRFSLDDFGAGLSSFGYLKVLPVDYLKIDGSFVRELTIDPISRSMVEAICQIGRAMELEIVAEFVGDAETVEILREIGVHFSQGYYIGMPAPLTEITQRFLGAGTAASA